MVAIFPHPLPGLEVTLLSLSSRFRLSYCPIRLSVFNELLMGVFGEGAKHEVFGDFEPLGQVETPAYYVHRIQKKDSDSCALASKPEPEQ